MKMSSSDDITCLMPYIFNLYYLYKILFTLKPTVLQTQKALHLMPYGQLLPSEKNLDLHRQRINLRKLIRNTKRDCKTFLLRCSQGGSKSCNEPKPCYWSKENSSFQFIRYSEGLLVGLLGLIWQLFGRRCHFTISWWSSPKGLKQAQFLKHCYFPFQSLDLRRWRNI